jgi:hypothetical protein
MQEILEKVQFLFEKYSSVKRGMTQPYLLEEVVKQFPDYQYNPGDLVIRESLIEHVGSLPMLAIHFFPYINDPEVNLGDALTMLAVHDIGELIVGDEIVFKKNPNSHDAEHDAALKLLDPSYHHIYEEAKARTTKSALFAKSIDKIAPDIIEYLVPAEITKKRMKHFLDIDDPDELVRLVVEHKRPHMLWNPFLTEFHIYLMERLSEKLRKI